MPFYHTITQSQASAVALTGLKEKIEKSEENNKESELKISLHPMISSKAFRR